MFLFFVLISCILQSEDLFMTEYDYSKMLYFEPNGVSCASCHGEDGKSNLVFEYVVYNKGSYQQKKVPVKQLQNLSFVDFVHGVQEKNRFMPIYRLSKQELTSIYYYIQKKNGLILSADPSLSKFYNESMRNKETTLEPSEPINRKKK